MPKTPNAHHGEDSTCGAFFGQMGKFSTPEASSSKPSPVLILPKTPSGKKVPLPLLSPRKMMFKAYNKTGKSEAILYLLHTTPNAGRHSYFGSQAPSTSQESTVSKTRSSQQYTRCHTVQSHVDRRKYKCRAVPVLVFWQMLDHGCQWGCNWRSHGEQQ